MLSRLCAVLSLAVLCPGCALLGPSCLDMKQGGHVTSVDGEVSAGGLTSHRLAYDTNGSQNTIHVHWPGAGTPAGPHLSFYLTRAACEQFELGAAVGSACAVLAQAGQRPGGPFASSLTVTHGRGNPMLLGDPPEYRIWVVGDAAVSTSYSLIARWSFGPDC